MRMRGFCEPLIDDLPEDVLELHQVDRRVIGQVAENLVGLPVTYPLLLPVPALLGEDGVTHPVEHDRVVPRLPGLLLDVGLDDPLDVVRNLRRLEERELPLASGIVDR